MQGNQIGFELLDRLVDEDKFLWQYDYGQRMRLTGVDLPYAYEVHFSNTNRGTSVASLGDENGVTIPDAVLTSGKPVYFWLFIPDSANSGATAYGNIIPVRTRSSLPTEEPTPVQQNEIEQFLAALNSAVETAQGLAESIPETIDAALQEAKDSGEFRGDPGAVFTPSVDDDGVMRWSNDGGLLNPDPVNLGTALHLDTYAKTEDLAFKIDYSEKGQPYGVANLNGEGKIPDNLLPPYVDDVLEFPSLSQFPNPGESGKLYISTSNNVTYRWAGNQYAMVGPIVDLSGKADKTNPVIYGAVQGYNTKTTLGEGLVDMGQNTLVVGRLNYNYLDKPGQEVPEWTSGTTYHYGDVVHYDTPGADYWFCVTGNDDPTFDDLKWSPMADGSRDRAFVIGNGHNEWGTQQELKGSNAMTVNWNGDTHVMGDVYAKANSDGTGGSKLAKVSELNDKADKTDTVLNTTLSCGRKSGTGEGTHSIAFGELVEASGKASVAFGSSTTAMNQYAISTGQNTTASGKNSKSGGRWSEASGDYSIAEGQYATANHRSQVAFGEYNVPDPKSGSGSTKGNYVEIVGNGTGIYTKSNARALDWNGNEYLKGDVYVGCESDSTGGTKLATVTEVNAKIDAPSTAGTSGQVLTSDGNGGQSWQDPTGGGGTVTDVQIDSTSILSSGVANIPVASSSALGAVKVGESYGIAIDSTGKDIRINRAEDNSIKQGSSTYKPIVSATQHKAVFYGLAKAAGDTTQSNSSNAVGTYTDDAKAAIRSMIGAENGADLIAVQDTEPTNPATQIWMTETPPSGVSVPTYAEFTGVIAPDYSAITFPVAKGQHCIKDGTYYVANQAISTSEEWTAAHWTSTTVGGESDIVVLHVDDNTDALDKTWQEISDAFQAHKIIIAPSDTDNFYVTYVEGDTNNYQVGMTRIGSTIMAIYKTASASGYPVYDRDDNEATVKDVQINGTSILSNGVANIPNASLSVRGSTIYATEANIKGGTASGSTITPSSQHISTFYGLAKAAGSDMASSSNAVGTYTDGAKTAIKNMLGVVDPVVPVFTLASVGNTYTCDMTYAQVYQAVLSNSCSYARCGEMIYLLFYRNSYGIGFIRSWVAAGSECDTEIFEILPDDSVEHSEMAADISSFVSFNFENYATSRRAYAVGDKFIWYDQANEDRAYLYKATSPIAIGDTFTVNSNCVYTDAMSELNLVEDKIPDIQINSTSIVSNGVANIPVAGSSTLGVVRADNYYGIDVVPSGNDANLLRIRKADSSHIKAGTNQYKPIVPYNQNEAVFYGLASASGDTTQASSSNTVGTYTETAISKISDMLNAPVSVSGSTPSFTAKSGVRYICGEVSTLSVTLPSSGDVELMFDSGSTATVLTLTPPSGVTSVKFPSWFDPTDLDANVTYNMIITNGEFGVVTSWA